MAKRIIERVSDGYNTATIYRDSEWDEYIVRVVGNSPEADYHTDDLRDALGTALVMLREKAPS